MKRVLKMNCWKSFLCHWVFCAICVGALAACGPPKPVSIPMEWQVPAPPPAQTPGVAEPQPALPRPQPQSPSHQQPILRPSPQIQEREVPPPVEVPPDSRPETELAQPQYLASMHLVDQARTSLAHGNADQAVALLEQAIHVDVYNGEAFYGLARAWRMKGSREKSLEFAGKAEILFQDQPSRLKEVYLFQADIFKDLGESAKADLCLQKAARL